MKVKVDLLLKLRKEKAWSQDELAMASGLNLRTIQRIENEATASLQSMKALASALDMNIRDLEYEESTMIDELLGKDVQIVMGLGSGRLNEFSDDVKGKIVEIEEPWLKILQKNSPIYININAIKRIVPQ